jgi:signal recognition particle subunit SRP19
MPDHFYVYPAYLEKGIARADGRRIPADSGLADLTLEEIARAAKRLGHSAEIESDKQYPRRYYAYAGRVKVGKHGGRTKAAFLRALAAELRKLRAEAPKR